MRVAFTAGGQVITVDPGFNWSPLWEPATRFGFSLHKKNPNTVKSSAGNHVTDLSFTLYQHMFRWRSVTSPLSKKDSPVVTSLVEILRNGIYLHPTSTITLPW